MAGHLSVCAGGPSVAVETAEKEPVAADGRRVQEGGQPVSHRLPSLPSSSASDCSRGEGSRPEAEFLCRQDT